MPVVISNTSPLQYLYQVEALFLLPARFRRVLVPAAVVGALHAGAQRNVRLPDAPSLSWLEARQVRQRALLPLVTHLGDGEKEVLALGQEIPGALLLLDDRNARRHGALLSLQMTGTLGVLLLGKERGMIDAILPFVDRLEALGFRLHPATRRHVLRLVRESD